MAAMTEGVHPKPCPFCGSTQIETREGSTFRWRLAYCVDCEATAGEVRVNKQDSWQAANDAVKEWNRRLQYICTCGIRVEPHECKTDGGF